jgi:hypothetical protein
MFLRANGAGGFNYQRSAAVHFEISISTRLQRGDRVVTPVTATVFNGFKAQSRKPLKTVPDSTDRPKPPD